ncbi:ABA4-like family protein [Candidatus Pelagibacter communis]|jgi:hypothetical protein|uniref:ABA4-like family protein n=1 Tax=Pelagibacter ubique TaxID=198252 RepID=UPI00094D180F|nr:ABA4-like family protein [Candidatus Pelagibacter ubique]
MIEQISDFFSMEMIYLWLNIGVLPFWFILIFFPQSNICRYFVTSIFPYLVLGSVYTYLLFLLYKFDYNFLDNFKLYLGIIELNDLFSDNFFLITFWTHFLAINLFCGSWIVRDSQKLLINKFLIIIPLLITYFIGVLGIFLYWIIRIFYSKRITLFD